MNWHAVRAIYLFEMARTKRTLLQSVLAPVITTSLYFVVFGAAIGARIPEVDGLRVLGEPDEVAEGVPEHRPCDHTRDHGARGDRRATGVAPPLTPPRKPRRFSPAGHTHQPLSTAPGFMMPRGSSAALIARITPRSTSGRRASARAIFERPNPCSAAKLPPMSLASRARGPQSERLQGSISRRFGLKRWPASGCHGPWTRNPYRWPTPATASARSASWRPWR